MMSIKDNLWEWSCPKCGSKDRVLQSIIDDDKSAGRVGEHIEIGALNLDQFPIKDPKKNYRSGDQVSLFTVWWDLCANCGTRYAFKAVREIQKVSMDVSHLLKMPPGYKDAGGFKGN